MSDATKKTIDEEIISRLQALEVLLMEQRKEIDSLKDEIWFQKKRNFYWLHPTNGATHV